MTENNYSYVIKYGNTKFYKNGKFMTSSEVLNELEVKDMIINQFSEENKDLKKENYGNLDGLNYYQEENASLSEKISNLEYDLDYYRAKSGSCEEGLFQKDKEIAKLEKENNELKERNKLIFEQIRAFRNDCVIYQDIATLNRLLGIIKEYEFR